ncbi:MAG TPA: fructosamine kinase family protein [Casimicrobiaceae bacterium]|nr:fructosamine kinase family protein [Casimicrobiaceae bacterium]
MTRREPLHDARWTRLGGDAHVSRWRVDDGSTRYFVKVGAIDKTDALDAEAEALRTIADTSTIRVPRVVLFEATANRAVLVLEWLDLGGEGRDGALGRVLAKLHDVTATRFGWHRDNAIGANPQFNAWADDWAAFFRDRRLRPQLELAGRNGYAPIVSNGAALLAAVPRILEGHRPAASLLHGDLWSGNAGALIDGTPVIFDPSSYYGDAETDVAMSELFGGFTPAFYAEYRKARPFAFGHEKRRTLYNLYHVLNHLNLFGASYLTQAQRMVSQLASGR